MKLHVILFIVLSSFLLSSCTVFNKNNSRNGEKDNEKIAKIVYSNLNYPDSLIVQKNQDNSKILYIAKIKSVHKNFYSHLNFLVLDNLKDEIIYKNKFDNAKIEWYNNNQLLLTKYMGILENKNTSNIKFYIIDLETEDIKEFKKQNEKL